MIDGHEIWMCVPRLGWSAFSSSRSRFRLILGFPYGYWGRSNILEQFRHPAFEAGQHVFAIQLVVFTKDCAGPVLPEDMDRAGFRIVHPQKARPRFDEFH